MQVPQGHPGSPGRSPYHPTSLPSPPVPHQHHHPTSHAPSTSQVNPIPHFRSPAWPASSQISQPGPDPALTLPFFPSYPGSSAAMSWPQMHSMPASQAPSPALHQQHMPELPVPYLAMDTDMPEPDGAFPPLPPGVTPAQAAALHSWWQQVVRLWSNDECEPSCATPCLGCQATSALP